MPIENVTLDFDNLYEEMQIAAEQLSMEYDQYVAQVIVERNNCHISAHNLSNSVKKGLVDIDCYLPEHLQGAGKTQLLKTDFDPFYQVDIYNGEKRVLSLYVHQYEDFTSVESSFFYNDKPELEKNTHILKRSLDHFGFESLDFNRGHGYYNKNVASYTAQELVNAVDNIIEEFPELNVTLKAPRNENGVSVSMRRSPQINEGKWRALFVASPGPEHNAQKHVSYVISQLKNAGYDFYSEDWTISDDIGNKDDMSSVSKVLSHDFMFANLISEAYSELIENTFYHPKFMRCTNENMSVTVEFDGPAFYGAGSRKKYFIDDTTKFKPTIDGISDSITPQQINNLVNSYGSENQIDIGIDDAVYKCHISIKNENGVNNVLIETCDVNPNDNTINSIYPLLNELGLDYTIRDHKIIFEKEQQIGSINKEKLFSLIDSSVEKNENMTFYIESNSGDSEIIIKKNLEPNNNSILSHLTLISNNEVDIQKDNNFQQIIDDFKSVGLIFTGTWTFKRGEKVRMWK